MAVGAPNRLADEITPHRGFQGAECRSATLADKITLLGAAERIMCPLLVAVGAEGQLVPPSQGERLAKTASVSRGQS
jgi:hypothetical protein